MKLNRTSAVADLRLVSRFESIRKRLLEQASADRLEKPLAYWVLPSDRRLPLAFLDRRIGELATTSFDDLYATPGVGRQKISSLVKLLARVVKDPASGVQVEEEPDADSNATPHPLSSETPFDPNLVSETVWMQWRQRVIDMGLGHEPLGRFAPTLEHLPRVVWNTPLSTYTGLTLSQIRNLKTHGEKRVTAVLEVFNSLYGVLGKSGSKSTLAVRVVPRFVDRLERWIADVLQRPALPDASEVTASFIQPLMDQVRVDAGDLIADLAEGRLALHGSESSVRQAAARLGLTRARVYQLLGEVAAIMEVRWPNGAQAVNRLSDLLLANSERRQTYAQFTHVVELCFPAHGESLDKPLRDEGNVGDTPHRWAS